MKNRLSSRIGTSLLLGTAVVAALTASAGAAQAAPAQSVAASVTADCSDQPGARCFEGYYDSMGACDDTGMNGIRYRWWVDYTCLPINGGSAQLFVKYHW